MQNLQRYLLFTVCVALTVACTGQKTFTQHDEEAIRTLLSEQVAAWNRGDIPAFMQGYWQSPKLRFVSSDTVSGWQTVRDRYQKRYDTPEKMGHLRFEVLEIFALGADHARILGIWELTPFDGAMAKGYFTLICERRTEGWRIVYDHTSSSS